MYVAGSTLAQLEKNDIYELKMFFVLETFISGSHIKIAAASKEEVIF